MKERLFRSERHPLAEFFLTPFYIPEFVLREVAFPLEKLVAWQQEVQLPQRIVDVLSTEDGRIWYYPWVGYSSSNGFSVGGTFKFNDIFYEDKSLTVSGKFYTNADWGASASFSKEGDLYSPLLFRIGTSFNNNTDAKFYGVGNSSPSSSAIYSLDEAALSFEAGWQFRRQPFLRIGGELGSLYVDTEPGNPESDKPSVEEVLPPGDLVAFGEEAVWLHYGMYITWDSRLPEGHPHRGVKLEVRYTRWDALANRVWDHDEVGVEAVKVFDLFRGDRVLALALEANAVPGWSDAEVPFYRLPGLDKDSPLRGFPSGRFHGRYAVVGNVEYRFPVWRAFDPDDIYMLATLFLDLGTVAQTVETLADGPLLWSSGIGVLMTTQSAFIFRAQVGYGGEDIEGVASLGRAF